MNAGKRQDCALRVSGQPDSRGSDRWLERMELVKLAMKPLGIGGMVLSRPWTRNVKRSGHPDLDVGPGGVRSRGLGLYCLRFQPCILRCCGYVGGMYRVSTNL